MAYQRRELAPRTHRFPVEKSEDYKGTITFRPVRYTPPEIQGEAFAALRRRAGAGLVNQFANFTEAAATEAALEDATVQGSTYDEVPASLDRTPNDNDTIVTGANSVVDRSRGVVLFLPANIVVNDVVSYEQFELGAIGAIGLSGMQAGQGAPAALARGVGQAGSSLIDLLRGEVSDQRGARLAASRAAQALPSRFGGALTAGVVRAGTATTVNPNSINLFKSVQLREFRFQFKLIANSAREAEEIDNIVRFFRATMYPDTIDFDPTGLNVPIGYDFPDKFQIEMRYNGEQVGVRILNSVLRDVQTNYNPQSMSWHKDGKPSEVDISLGFGEERTLNRNDIFEGY